MNNKETERRDTYALEAAKQMIAHTKLKPVEIANRSYQFAHEMVKAREESIKVVAAAQPYDENLLKHVACLNISTGCFKCFDILNIKLIGQLVQIEKEDLQTCRGSNESIVLEVENALLDIGLHLDTELPMWKDMLEFLTKRLAEEKKEIEKRAKERAKILATEHRAAELLEEMADNAAAYLQSKP